MLKVSVFEESDLTIWVPVAKDKNGIPARAFLPFNGLDGFYKYGYKAAPSEESYINALREIQQSFLDDTKKLFSVKNGQQNESQHKARWRHGRETGAPILGPTLGWVRVPVHLLTEVTGDTLGKLLRNAGAQVTEFPESAEPVLCETAESLEHESARLYDEASTLVPLGQESPKKIENSTKSFVRDAAVVAYVLRAADGRCECCSQPAPFSKSNGLPYLEVHHVKRLASGGSDKISNAVGVCPNCHRELHHGKNTPELVEKLYDTICRLLRE